MLDLITRFCILNPMETLGKIFGSISKVKVMRFFLLNDDRIVPEDEIKERLRIPKSSLRKELNLLAKTGLIKVGSTTVGMLSKGKLKRKKVKGWSTIRNFPYREKLYNLLVDGDLVDRTSILKRFRGIGKIDLFILAGVFIHDPKSRIDFMIVGKRLNKKKIEQVVRSLEAEIGKELTYSLFELEDFKYRVEMFDKLVCDVMEYPHEVIVGDETPYLPSRIQVRVI
jgi:hypothetical protein